MNTIGVEARRWTRAEYERMIEHGVFHEDEHLELVDGEILTMSPQSSLHAGVITLAAEALRIAFGEGRHVRVQMPLSLDDLSVPEPDLAVVEGTGRAYLAAHPETAVLVVESADSTLPYDRGRKAGLYARSGIRDYWIVNVADRVLEVYRDPQPATAVPLGFAYASTERLGREAFVSPLAAPEARIAVADLLP
jgi:Uma2 family endonuclease